MTSDSEVASEGSAKLFHYPMACSTAVRIAAAEAGVELDIQEVDVYSKDLSGGGGSLFEINPLGQVPTLKLPSGEIISENVAIMYSIEAQRGAVVSPQIIRWLSFCATELHKGIIWPIARGEASPEVRVAAAARLSFLSRYLDAHLTGRNFVAAEGWSAADAYLLWCLQLLDMLRLKTGPSSTLSAYTARLIQREHVSMIFTADRQRLRELTADRRPLAIASNPAFAGTSAR